MLKACAHPYFCASNTCLTSQLVDHLTTLMDYPDLHQEEKWLWIWLATQAQKLAVQTCSYSYEDLSLVMNQSCKAVHRALFRLLTMGFLSGNLPIWYGELSPQMCHEVRVLTLKAPNKDFVQKVKALQAGLMSNSNLSNLKPGEININLLKAKGKKC